MRMMFEPISDPNMMGGGGFAPFIVCDTCGDRIVGQQAGIVVFDRELVGPVRAIHRGACETEVTRSLSWQDLDLFLRNIARNAGINSDETGRRINEPGGLADYGLHH